MTVQTTKTIEITHDPAAMRVRNAMRDLLRAWEEMYNLPRTFQTKVERGEAPAKQEHHNRG